MCFAALKNKCNKSSVINYLTCTRPCDSCLYQGISFLHSINLYKPPIMPSTIAGLGDMKQLEVPTLLELMYCRGEER